MPDSLPGSRIQSSRRGYDPIYANQRWQNRRDRGWEQRAQANFQNLRDNENGRPPRNWAAQRALTGRGQTSNRQNIAVAEQLDELAQRKDRQVRLKPVDPVERQQFGQRGQEYRKYLQQRQQLEAANAARTPGGDPANAAEPARRKFAKSPYVGPSTAQLGQGLRAATAPSSSQAGLASSAPTESSFGSGHTWNTTGPCAGDVGRRQPDRSKSIRNAGSSVRAGTKAMAKARPTASHRVRAETAATIGKAQSNGQQQALEWPAATWSRRPTTGYTAGAVHE